MNEEKIPEFGIKRENEERRDGGVGIVFDPASQKYAVVEQHKDGLFRLLSGGIDEKENIQDGVIREVIEESGLDDFLYIEETAKAFAHYHNNLRNVNRVAMGTCFLLILKSTHTVPVSLEEHENFSLAWATAQEILDNWGSRNENHDYDHWIYFLKKSVTRAVELGYDKISKI